MRDLTTWKSPGSTRCPGLRVERSRRAISRMVRMDSMPAGELTGSVTDIFLHPTQSRRYARVAIAGAFFLLIAIQAIAQWWTVAENRPYEGWDEIATFN